MWCRELGSSVGVALLMRIISASPIINFFLLPLVLFTFSSAMYLSNPEFKLSKHRKHRRSTSSWVSSFDRLMYRSQNGLGIYSGIFAIYLQFSFTRKEPRTTNIVFYALCLLYVISTAATFACDLPAGIIEVTFSSVRISFLFYLIMQLGILPPAQLEIDIQSITPVMISQITINGFCDLIFQCILVRINHCTYHLFYSPTNKSSKIYRCWIVWGKNIRVIIIPSFLGIVYLGQ